MIDKYHKGGHMETPKYDDEFNYWQSPMRNYYREEAVNDTTTAERFKEIAFFSNVATFSIAMTLTCSILSAFLPISLAVILSIAVSLTLLQVTKKAIKTVLWIIKK
jgi:hypothetical protein